MPEFSALLQQGASNAWLFIPSAILLGALHGLEPGHSKTMMAAFIVAIRGTVTQAVLLGLAATLSHTLVVWAVALGGMWIGQGWNAEATEPYFQLASAVLIVAVALWMAARTWRDQHAGHGHSHGDESHRIDTGHGDVLVLEVFEDGVPPRFRIRSERQGRPAPAPGAASITVETLRPDGTLQQFSFLDEGAFLESVEEIPEPHEFVATVRVGHVGHDHEYPVRFVEHAHHHETAHDHSHHHHHGHGHEHGHHGHDHGGHDHAPPGALDLGQVGYQDAHERAHARDIQHRFAGRQVTTGQIILFGLTGGLIPCPAAITVLLLCLQLKEVTLGAALVVCFSIGLALTLVAAGAIAALGMRHAERRWSGAFSSFARRAPYLSSAVIILVGLYVGIHALQGLGYTLAWIGGTHVS
ncbi:nickel/cobalt efflux protein RcnA [Azospirillum palustre]|uniref:Nickel/cobalt efflux system n=1 Tax=Azospirillum palustre TaxID=2044885 RepID=A0A2B8B6E3_9PROT|nr:nickel/cobalt efflux transporter [Azospirillum palustre]PGH56854.1 nickel/cobalt efflux protein RcnA [Azospirillum palustre]